MFLFRQGKGVGRRSAAALVLLVTGLAAGCGGESDQALAELEATSASIARTGRLLRATDALSDGRAEQGVNLADRVQDELADSTEPIAELEEAAAAQAGAAEQIGRIGAALDAAQQPGPKLAGVRQAKTGLEAQSSAVRRLKQQLIAAAAAVEAGLVAVEEDLGEDLSEQQAAAVDEAKTALEPLPASINAVTSDLEIELTTESDKLAATIDELSGPPPVTGPASCGTSASGTQVAVIEGTISCEEAIEVINASTGPNSASSLPGWDCSLPGQTVNGTQVQFSSGFSCRRGSVQISTYIENAAPTSSGPASQADCPGGAFVPADEYGNPGYCETGGEGVGE